MDLLVDKYRPQELDDVFGNEETIKTLKCIIETKNFPHLLFTGPPGTGKTTCAKIISKKLIQFNYKERVLELNASDERGIDVIRNRIKAFSNKRIDCNGIKKIIILDEADSMTTAAQQALRRIMETSLETRFILICNTFSKIFEPIQSRCAVLKFERLNSHEISKVLQKIALKEKIQLNSAENMIVALSDGDMRQALNILQSCHFFDRIDDCTVLSITGQPSPKVIEEIVEAIYKNNITLAINLFNSLWDQKYDPIDLIQGFFRHAKKTDDYDLMKAIGPVHMRIIEGINTKLQFYGMFYQIMFIKTK